MSDLLLRQIALSCAHGIHANTLRELLDRIGSVDAFYDLSQAELTGLCGYSLDIFADSYRSALLAEAAHEAEFVRSNNIEGLFLDSPAYPHRLAQCDDAPTMLYKLGSCDLDSAHMVAIVGTRNATIYGIEFTKRLVADLADKIDNLVIVSGLAYGIDITAHTAALAAGVPTVGVVAHGLNTLYPSQHRQTAIKMLSSGGALISEYTSGTRIHRANFLARNRIIAGLCDCVVVVESDYRGGAMSTARTAAQYNREVLAVPGRITDKYSLGTNQLIANNIASLICDADSLIKQLGWSTRVQAADPQPTLFTPLTPDQQMIYDYLSENQDATANEICVSLSLSYAKTADILFQLEMADRIKALPGGRYALFLDI